MNSLFQNETELQTMVSKAHVLLGDIFKKSNICISHGISHAMEVTIHAFKALQCISLPETSSKRIKENVLLAALLHDADDRKFFPSNTDFENARLIIKECCKDDDMDDIITMIDLVSTSKNGNNKPSNFDSQPWLLIPRWADRIEAVGWIGIKRCWDYTLTSDRLLFTPYTQRAQNELELKLIATKERFDSYKGSSASMIDHYYDKLLHIDEVGNEYIDNQIKYRKQIMIDFCIDFGIKGYVDQDWYAMATKNI